MVPESQTLLRAMLQEEGHPRALEKRQQHPATHPLSSGNQFAPMVRRPSGSTARASSSASLLARSALAGDTASTRHVGCRMYSSTARRMRASMSLGWSPTGTLAMPGRSTSVIVLSAG